MTDRSAVAGDATTVVLVAGDVDQPSARSADADQKFASICSIGDDADDDDQQEVCRICHSGGSSGEPLLAPCKCSGSVRYVHETCLQRWLLRDVAEGGLLYLTEAAAANRKCELCHADFVLTTRLRPFREWRKLNMTCAEKRKVICSAVFHVIAVACVAWSLYVLIERAIEEVHEHMLESSSDGTAARVLTLQWPFWTKLAVVVVGLVGASVFVYIQFKAYVVLLARWRAINRVIHVQGEVLSRQSEPQHDRPQELAPLQQQQELQLLLQPPQPVLQLLLQPPQQQDQRDRSLELAPPQQQQQQEELQLLLQPPPQQDQRDRSLELAPPQQEEEEELQLLLHRPQQQDPRDRPLEPASPQQQQELQLLLQPPQQQDPHDRHQYSCSDSTEAASRSGADDP